MKDSSVARPNPGEAGEEKEVKKGGIIIPEPPRKSPRRARSSRWGTGSVNDEGKKVPLDVKAGDKILSASTPFRGQARRRGVPDHEGRRRPRHHQHARIPSSETRGDRDMPKQLMFSDEGRAALLRGININGGRGQGHLGRRAVTWSSTRSR